METIGGNILENPAYEIYFAITAGYLLQDAA